MTRVPDTDGKAPLETTGPQLTNTSEHAPSPTRSESTRGPSARRGEVRDRIRTVARAEFIERGYNGATVGRIARNAGCTSAMVSYYFGSKQRLFRECFSLPLDPVAIILDVLKAGREGAGERVVRRAFQLYEDEMTAETMTVLMRSLLNDVETNQYFRNFMREEVMDKVGTSLGVGKELAEEMEFAIATMFGIVTMRYIVKLEPLASMPRERLVRELAPIVQHRLNRVFARRDLRSR